jgi:hypothetical protein
MRNLIIFTVLLVFASCTEPQIVVIEPIGLGENPQVNAIIGYSVVNNTAHVKAKTTIGAKYSLQLSKLGQSEPIKAQGFTATAEESNLVISFDKTEAGIYDLILLDINGNASKLPINIK